ncbi:MAG: cohesin domain-containing protein [Syntrophales bacterium]
MDMSNCRRTCPHAARGSRFNLLLPALVFFALLYGFPVFGAELTIPDLRIRSGEDVRVPLIVDQVEHLAGVKLVINYNKELLTFKGGARSKSTDSMMHVINDKTPGKLIVVMAAARGISGKDVTLLTLFFSLKKGPADKREALIQMTDVQLMGDDLKDIPCKVKMGTETE